LSGARASTFLSSRLSSRWRANRLFGARGQVVVG
jgi:hypothetical protein